jgi:Methyltransferase domain
MESRVEVLKHSIDRTSLRVPARAAWRSGWAVRRSTRRLVAWLGARMLYGRQANALPAMEYPPGHYHSPIPSASEVDEFTARSPSLQDAVEGVDLNRDGQLALLQQLAVFYDEQPFMRESSPRTRYRFRNDFLPGADAIVLYCMLRHLRPRRVIEIGSGWSTCVTLDTSDLFLDSPPDLLLVEPYPDRLLELVRAGDLERFDLQRVLLQDAPLTPFRSLQANDFLFVDSTHVTKVGSDVNRLFFEILPVLAPGVYVHIHDIAYPFEYPRSWIGNGRFWNEAYLARAFLQYNANFEIVLFLDYLRAHAADLLRERYPALMEGVSASGEDRGGASSLWLRRVR